MSVFDGRVALVTGAGHGMGKAFARALLEAGADVVLADVDDDATNALAAEWGDHATALHLDVSSETDWQSGAGSLIDRFGRIDVLVNSAGILRYGGVETQTLADFRAVMDINLIGTFLGMKAVLPRMRAAGHGSVVNICSTAALVGNPDGIAYGASKWAVRGMTKSAAVDMAGSGVRINAVHPGFVATDLNAETADGLTDRLPIPRYAAAAEVARTVLFLAGDDSSYCTGAEFVVDGGLTAGPTQSYRG